MVRDRRLSNPMVRYVCRDGVSNINFCWLTDQALTVSCQDARGSVVPFPVRYPRQPLVIVVLAGVLAAVEGPSQLLEAWL